MKGRDDVDHDARPQCDGDEGASPKDQPPPPPPPPPPLMAPAVAAAAVATSVDDGAGDDEAEIWRGFEQSVAYLSSLAGLYQEAFVRPPTGTRKALTPANVEAAKEHAREAIELLASNLLNASTAIVARLEEQDEAVAGLAAKLGRVNARLREREAQRDHEILERLGGRPRRPADGNNRNSKHTESSASTPTSSARQPRTPGLRLSRATAAAEVLYH